MSARPSCLLLLLAACGRDPRPRSRPKIGQRPPSRRCRSSSRRSPTAQDREDSGDAAATLKRYYARIEAGDYDSAWEMRSGEGGEEARRRFADNFRAYRATMPTSERRASRSRRNGWAYVEVPVMIRGTFRGGKPFASAGSVTVRRATSGEGERELAQLSIPASRGEAPSDTSRERLPPPSVLVMMLHNIEGGTR